MSASPDSSSAAPADVLRGQHMQRSLAALLDQVPEARSGLPHLAALETSLAQHGTARLSAISHRVLSKILSQLRVLPLDPADGHLQDLVALLQRALRQQLRELETRREHQLSPFDPMSTVVITEGSTTDFMNAIAEAKAGTLR